MPLEYMKVKRATKTILTIKMCLKLVIPQYFIQLTTLEDVVKKSLKNNCN